MSNEIDLQGDSRTHSCGSLTFEKWTVSAIHASQFETDDGCLAPRITQNSLTNRANNFVITHFDLLLLSSMTNIVVLISLGRDLPRLRPSSCVMDAIRSRRPFRKARPPVDCAPVTEDRHAYEC